MNTYTNDEIKKLLSEFNVLNNCFVIGNNGLFIEKSIFISFVFLDPTLEIKEFISFYGPVSKREIEELTLIRKLIYYTSLYRMPLYINLSPEVTKWRLEISK